MDPAEIERMARHEDWYWWHRARRSIVQKTAGIDAAGTAYRMDGVPIRLKKVIERGYPDDAEILKKIYDRINGGMGP